MRVHYADRKFGKVNIPKTYRKTHMEDDADIEHWHLWGVSHIVRSWVLVRRFFRRVRFYYMYGQPAPNESKQFPRDEYTPIDPYTGGPL